MKKIFSILFASVIAFMAVSCYPEDLAVFDTSKAKAPVLGSYEVGEKAITAEYTPATFNQNFKTTAPNHFFVMTTLNGQTVNKVISTNNKDGVLSVSKNSLMNLLMSMGFNEGDVVDFTLCIRASLQSNAGDNGRNGHVDSDGTINVTGFEIVFPKGSPYQEYTETSPFSVIGALSEYGINWDGDLEMWMTPDGNLHVAKCVTIASGDEFKFRKDQDWGVNYGGDFGSLGNSFPVSQDGPNVKAPAGVYDLWLDLSSGTATLTEAYQAYPDHKEASNWSVIGALSELGINWDGDVAMLTDGTTHVAQGVKLSAADEFKFRQDKDWTVNLGGDFGSLGSDFAVSQDGPNVKVGAAGVYDLIVNPGAGTAQVVETLGGGVSGKIGGDEPEPEPEPVTGWNIIGLNGDWDNDILATADGNVYTAYIQVAEATEFKWRLDGGWTADFGGTFTAVGEPFTAEPGGPNIQIGPGFWRVVLDVDNSTITISEGDVWSLIGDFNGWAGDVDMTLVDGKWVSPVTKLNANGFKIRYNHDWAVSVGGTFEAFKTPFPVSDDNVMLPAEGEYIVTFDPEARTIMVEKAITGWNVIGLNGDWENDIIANENNNIWTVRVNAPEATEFKWRKDGAWDENYGGDFAELGVPFAAVPGGNNVKLDAGYWLLTLDFTGAEPVLMVSDGTVWSLIGEFNSWSGDVDMTLVDGIWESPETPLSGEFKLRMNHDWGENRGGDMAALGEPFDAVAGGNNIKVDEGTYVVTYDPQAEKITVKNAKKVWSVIGDFNSWSADADMAEVAPGIWISDEIEITGGGWKVRYDHDWTENRGGATPKEVGEFVGAFPGGDNVGLTGKFRVVYNANNETLGTLGFGVVGSVASIPGFSWNNDIPMNYVTIGDLGSGWMSVPIYLTPDDEIKIRWNAAWDINFGGVMTNVDEPFTAEEGGANIKVPAEGIYSVIYAPAYKKMLLTQSVWSLIGDFNSWSGDVFMMFDGENWVAYNQTLQGGWKLRKGAGWDVNRGGTFVEVNKPFEAVAGGDNINVGDISGFAVKYNQTDETITVVK